MLKGYRLLTALLSPLITLLLYKRLAAGKEDRARIAERFGNASKPRPKGTLLWLHAASVGEANSVLLLISKIRERFPEIEILLTTGTVTSAKLMQSRLPKEVIHQYSPVDMPKAVKRFITHWQPDIALWVESEFWPNMVTIAYASGCFLGVVNARMSEKSFRSWQKYPGLIHPMLACFNAMFAQSEEDAKRLQLLGAKNVSTIGNLKYDAALLPCDEGELIMLKNAIGSRPVWMAASTHPGEEEMVAQAHTSLATHYPILTIIVPRHPQRGSAIATELRKHFKVSLRSAKEPITADTHIYIADTLGELGLFYRLSEIVFMGGSLVAHGGQNPLEPARLACAILTGPHTHNFADIYQEMEKIEGCIRVTDAHNLATQIDQLLKDAKTREAMQAIVKQWMEYKGGTAKRLLHELTPIFEPEAA